MISTGIVSFADAHRVVGKVDIAVVAWSWLVVQGVKLLNVVTYRNVKVSQQRVLFGGRKNLYFGISKEKWTSAACDSVVVQYIVVCRLRWFATELPRSMLTATVGTSFHRQRFMSVVGSKRQSHFQGGFRMSKSTGNSESNYQSSKWFIEKAIRSLVD
jgi:hypothetical protein